MKKWIKRTIIGILSIILLGFLIPQNLKMPVVGADSNDYNHETFWYEGWGTSIVHKGVDVFAKKGTRINSATWGAGTYYCRARQGRQICCCTWTQMEIALLYTLGRNKNQTFCFCYTRHRNWHCGQHWQCHYHACSLALWHNHLDTISLAN